jgi:coenzyme F420-reducing hydrogenase delta subunit
MCSGRVSEAFIWHAFENGVPVILISGCHINDCHYINANHWTEKRVARMKRIWKSQASGLNVSSLSGSAQQRA